MKLSNKITAYLKQNQLVSQNNTVVLGVSGGMDSMALLHYFMSIQHEFVLRLIVVHVDHMFRGQESFEDYQFVESVCFQHGIEFVGARVDVPAYKKRHKINSQVAARQCRYDVYRDVMRNNQASYLALGHHGDDQIETVLMKLVRGGSGNLGMSPSRSFDEGKLIRPLLCVTKEEISTYCQQEEITYRHDSSNDTDFYQRNRFRKTILPFLKAENPRVHERFLHFSSQLQEDEQYLQELSIQKMNNVIKKKKENEVIFSITQLLSLPKSLQLRVIQLILNYLYKEDTSSLSSIHIQDSLLMLTKGKTSSELSLPKGLKLIRSYDNGKFTFNASEPSAFFYEIQEEGHVRHQDWEIRVSRHSEVPIGDDTVFVCRREDIVFPICIRNRVASDRIRVKGMKGTKKVNRLFIDKKIPRDEREEWPIVVDGENQMLWVPLLQKSIYEIASICIDDFVVIEYIRY